MGSGLIKGLTALALVAGLITLFRVVLEKASLPRASLVVGNGAEPQSLDPALVTAIPASRVLNCLFEGLTRPHPETLEPLPAMAQSWEVSEDGRTYTFTLRPGLRWSDGVPITASDLRWSYLRFLDPKTAAPNAYQLDPLLGARAFNRGDGAREAVGVRAPDAHTLVFELNQPTPWFLDLAGFFSLHPVPRHLVEEHGNDWVRQRPFVSNGPFRLQLRRIRDRIRCVRNERYWDVEKVALETVDMLATGSKTTLLNLYMSDRADWICDVPEAAVPTLQRTRGPDRTGEFDPRAYLGTYYLRLNTARPPLNNEKIRLALGLAVDREAIVRTVTRAGELPAASFSPPGMRDYTPPKVCTLDVERAKRLFKEGLAELGLSEAPTLEYLYNTRDLHRSIAEVLQDQWSRTLGLRVLLRNMEWGAYKAACARGDYAIARASWYGDYNDPHTYASCYVTDGANNQTGFSDPTYDRIVLEQAPATRDTAERAALLADAERILLESGAILPIYHDVTRNLVKPWVRGFHQNVQDIHLPSFMRIEGRR